MLQDKDTAGSLAAGWTEPRATAVLVLQDGTVLEGFGIGALGEATGEVCFNTAMTGYQEILALLQKMVKQRQESIAMYEQGGRTELAQQEKDEVAVITSYLPQQMDEAETRTAIEAAIAETGAASMKDMGKVIAALRGQYAGRMDFAKASGLVKDLLPKG